MIRLTAVVESRTEARFMIQCDFCEEWYHRSCVNLTATHALAIDRYKCSGCKGRN